MALTVGVATVLDSREVLVVVTGQRKSLALSKAIEGGVNHLVRYNYFVVSYIYLTYQPFMGIVDTFGSPNAPLGSDCR